MVLKLFCKNCAWPTSVLLDPSFTWPWSQKWPPKITEKKEKKKEKKKRQRTTLTSLPVHENKFCGRCTLFSKVQTQVNCEWLSPYSKQIHWKRMFFMMHVISVQRWNAKEILRNSIVQGLFSKEKLQSTEGILCQPGQWQQIIKFHVNKFQTDVFLSCETERSCFDLQWVSGAWSTNPRKSPKTFAKDSSHSKADAFLPIRFLSLQICSELSPPQPSYKSPKTQDKSQLGEKNFVKVICFIVLYLS